MTPEEIEKLRRQHKHSEEILHRIDGLNQWIKELEEAKKAVLNSPTLAIVGYRYGYPKLWTVNTYDEQGRNQLDAALGGKCAMDNQFVTEIKKTVHKAISDLIDAKISETKKEIENL